MRLICFNSKEYTHQYGWVLDDKVGLIEGSLFGEFRRVEANLAFGDIQLIAPVVPGKIICIGRNYIAHAEEHEAEVPETPLIFLKPPSSIIGHGETIFLPPQSNQVEHEAELAIVIGKTGRWISAENSLDHILGYTVANDVTARDLQRRDGQWTRGKGFDTFCPVGPWIETDFDPNDTMITCHVNDELRQMGTTRDMVFTVRQLIVFISSVMTLDPGDLILTGTPAGVGPLQPGDLVAVTIEGLGEIFNPVEAEPVR
ncbi:MAG: fumarylacetoacetate hydrolase family protein [Anaerolineales bacterium]|jgi:2-keto-4-pentenoate hydratase/2-oxohepta-3-ene-1,7-dioic acid hydratase in catechol pathway